jgi:hypothetical protein
MRTIFFFCFLFLSQLLAGQTITGIVYDKELNEPVVNATVYLDGTSFNAITNETGKFVLTTRKDIEAKLVISFIGYERIILEPPFTNLPDTFFLKEMPTEITAVVVDAKEGRYTRERKMKAFKSQFLGKTTAGKACTILNEEVINLLYDSKERVLTATANAPILVENKYLGYKIYYDLAECSIHYSRNNLNDADVLRTFFIGTSSYMDDNKADNRLEKNRETVYDKSVSNFFRNLYDETLYQSNFHFSKDGATLQPDECFTVLKGLGKCLVTINPVLFGKREDNRRNTEIGYVNIWHDNNQSQIIFYTDVFWINANRLISPIGKVSFAGEMGDQRVGDQLPLDYLPTPSY